MHLEKKKVSYFKIEIAKMWPIGLVKIAIVPIENSYVR
jgi:hypothetical protein